MSKYKSKDGIELSLSADNSTNNLIKEVVTEAIDIMAPPYGKSGTVNKRNNPYPSLEMPWDEFEKNLNPEKNL